MNWSDPEARHSFVEAEAQLALTVVASNRSELRTHIAERASRTDSPVEAQFAAWFDAARSHHLALGQTRFALQLRPQFWINTTSGTYRLDFALEPLDEWLAGAFKAEGLTLRIGVELDGHDFHEKSREDVTRRNQRDRDLAAMKWRVLHFSGSELTRNPMVAVVEVLVAGADALDLAKAALLHG